MNGCELMRCADYKPYDECFEGDYDPSKSGKMVCAYVGDICKYQEEGEE